MIKNIFIGAVFLLVTTEYVAARPEVSKQTSCYEVMNDLPSKKFTCKVTSGGGAGTSALIYSFNHKSYQILHYSDDESFEEKFEMNNLPVVGYARDKAFKKTEVESKVAYYCYVTKKEHICAVQ